MSLRRNPSDSPPAPAAPSRLLARLGGELTADVRYALRAWRGQPAFVAIAVLSLACGIGLNTAVFSIVNTVFLQSIRGVPEPDRVVSVGGRSDFATFRAVGDTLGGLRGVAAWQPVAVELHVGELHRRDVAPAVSTGYFEVLGVRPLLGRFFPVTEARTPPAVAEVVLDYEFWQREFGGDPAVIGRDLRLGNVPVTVVGVAPRSFHGFGPERPPLWLPLGLLPALRGTPPQWDEPAETGWRIFGRLAPGVALGQVNAELAAMAARDLRQFPDGPLTGTIGAEQWSGPVSAEKRIEFLLVVVMPLAVVGLILWIGCSNVATLLLARASGRRREIAIRMATGASRARLLRMLLVEGGLLAAAGAGLGLLLAVWTLDLIWLTLPDAPRLAVELDLRVLAYTAVVAASATLLFALVPALHATRLDVAPLMKGDDPGTGSAVRDGRRLRRFFLVTQFACSVALLVVAGTFVRAVVATYQGPAVALMDHLALASIETDRTGVAARQDYWDATRARLRQVPGVEGVSVLSPAGSAAIRVAATPAAVASGPTVRIEAVDDDYVRTAGLTLVAGRAGLATGRQDAREPALVDERAAGRIWGTSAVVGRSLSLEDGTALLVIGVVRGTDDEPHVYRARAADDFATAAVLVRTAPPSEESVPLLRAALRSAATDAAIVRVETLRETATGFLTRVSRLATVIGVGVLALAAVGLYGAVAFVTSMRTREIAIRTAVGAPASAVIRLVAREAVIVVGAGLVLGLALTGVAFRFMSGMIFARWTLDPSTVLPVLALFAITAAAACVLPGRRALRVDPMRVLQGN